MRTRILVVDDEEIVRLSCHRILTGEGYGVDIAVGGTEALRLARTNSYDLVILDVLMPGLDGFTVMQTLRGIHPDLKVIIISGLDETGMSIRAGELGTSAYIGKPFEPDELISKVSYVLKAREA